MNQTGETRSAFVTGATGAVGGALVRELKERGWKVHALHRPASNTESLKELGVNLIEGDISDPGRIVGRIPPTTDVVFHVAGNLSVSSARDAEQMRDNVDGTRNVIEATLKAQAGRFIHTSTLSAYGRHKPPISEDTPSAAPKSFICYERSKWLAEEEVRAAVKRGLDAVIINPGAIMGPGFTAGWADLFYQVRDGLIKALPPGELEVNHMDEVVKAHIAAAEKGRTGENYILTGERASFADMIRKAGELVGVEVKAKPINAPLLMALAWATDKLARLRGKEPDMTPELAAVMCQTLHCDTDKARRELGYKHVPWQVCMTEMYEWLHSRGKI